MPWNFEARSGLDWVGPRSSWPNPTQDQFKRSSVGPVGQVP